MPDRSPGFEYPRGFAAGGSRSTSLDSVQSIRLRDDDRTPQAGLFPENEIASSRYNEPLIDCVVLLVHCKTHHRVALRKTGRGEWLPFILVKPTESWKTAAMAILNETFKIHDKLKHVPFDGIQLIHVQRLQLPETKKFVTSSTFEVKVHEVPDWKCCLNSQHIHWATVDEMKLGFPLETKLYGFEPLSYLSIISVPPKEIDEPISEFTTEDAIIFSRDATTKKKFEELVASARVSQVEILKMYGEFLEHCYPSFMMTLPAFGAFAEKHNIVGDTKSLFRAFCISKNGYLTFIEVLLGIAAMDPATSSGDIPAQLRCSYIFRYYDNDSDGLLDHEDIARMTVDIKKTSDTRIEPSLVQTDTDERWAILHKPNLFHNVHSPDDKVPETVFLNAVGHLVFRGTSGLFRTPTSVLKIAQDRANQASLTNETAALTLIHKRQYKGVCPGCRSMKYSLASHSCHLDFQGRITNPVELIRTEGRDLPQLNIQADPVRQRMRNYSQEMIFRPESLANDVLTKLRQFDRLTCVRGHYPIAIDKAIEERSKAPVHLREWTADKKTGIELIYNICNLAEDIFKKELRVLKVQSPCFVMGDIHGNFSDLMTFERVLWRKGPWISDASYLFLGDYVDRGPNGIECVLYLFACKILAPDKFFLCRGNHEMRDIQRMFTFEQECNQKYGAIEGPKIWERMNQVFDSLPIAAVIDNKIFCAHGGIPKTDPRVSNLLTAPVPLFNPEEQHICAWEVMWNDPMDSNDLMELTELTRERPDKGFLPNDKRGTGYFFDETAVDNFLAVNGLTHIIRGHEVQQPGYKFHMSGKVITIFSSSGYCGLSNTAATLFVDDEKIRLIQLDTTNNPPWP